MLAIISGLLHADRGTVCINGRRIDRGGPLAFSRAGIVRSFQHPRLVPDLRVWENIAVGAHQRRPEADVSLIADQMELSDPQGSGQTRSHCQSSGGLRWAGASHPVHASCYWTSRRRA